MQLRSVRLKNFRSFASGSLELGAGTTLLWGDVGAGKTSILYAIEMALFGFAEVEPTFLIRHRATTAEVALGLADDRHSYTFTRRFHRRLRRGRDIFELDEKGTGLSTDGRMTLYPSTELRQRAIDLLGFPDNPNPRAHSDLWRWAVYVPQERMRQILESDDAQLRLETVRKALGLERYRTAAENAQTVARELRGEAVARSEEADHLEHWEADLDRFRQAVESAEAASAIATGEVEQGRVLLAEAEAERATSEARRRQLEGDRREREEIGRRLKADREAATGLERRLAEALARARGLEEESASLDREAAGLPEFLRQLAGSTDRRRSLSVELEQAEEGRRELDRAEAIRTSTTDREALAEQGLAHGRQEHDEAGRRLEAALAEGPRHAPSVPTPREVPEIEAELAEATADAERRAGDLRHLTESMQVATTLVERGVCPTCGQKVETEAFEGHRRETEAALVQCQTAQAQSAERRQALSAERGARERYERSRLAWIEAEKRRSEARAAVDRAAAQLVRLGGDRDAARSDRDAAERRVVELAPRARAVEEARERVRANEAETSSLERRTAELRSAADAARARRESAAEVRGQIETVRLDLARSSERIAELAHRAEELGSKLVDAEVVESGLAKASANVEAARHRLEHAVGNQRRAEGDAESGRDRARQAEVHLAERRTLQEEARRGREVAAYLSGPFRDGLLELERRLLTKAKVEFDRSLARYFALLIEDPALVARSDPQFSPSVEIDGELTPPEALSGGERTALALAFRLALGQVVRRAERLRLDTLILDEPTDGFSPEQVQRMGELITELRIPQVILVSHEQLLGGVADRVVRIRKVDGASEIDPASDPRPIPSAEAMTARAPLGPEAAR